MAVPTPGDIEVRFNRTYVVVNPNAALGPPTYRLSSPDEIPGDNGGGGDAYDFKGEVPIVVNTIPGVGTNPSTVTTEMDITRLNER